MCFYSCNAKQGDVPCVIPWRCIIGNDFVKCKSTDVYWAASIYVVQMYRGSFSTNEDIHTSLIDNHCFHVLVVWLLKTFEVNVSGVKFLRHDYKVV